ncbi:MAG: hypothetical protein AAF430_17195 [Myxococcota bacterium]
MRRPVYRDGPELGPFVLGVLTALAVLGSVFFGDLGDTYTLNASWLFAYGSAPGALVGFVVGRGLVPEGTPSRRGAIATLGLAFGVLSGSAAIHWNAFGPQPAPALVSLAVEDIEYTRGGYNRVPSYRILLCWHGESRWRGVSKELYRRMQAPRLVDVLQGPGALGFPHILEFGETRLPNGAAQLTGQERGPTGAGILPPCGASSEESSP